MSEAKRKIVRLSVLIFPGLYLFLDKNILVFVLGFLSLILLAAEILRYFFPVITQTLFQYLSRVTKERERNKISGISWLIWGAFFSILFFEKNIAITALLFVILGDAAASLVRTKIAKIKLFGKGIEGNFAALTVCLVIGIVLQKSFNLSLLSIGAASIAAAITELIPLRIKNFYIDDNFSMSLVGGLVLTLLS